MRCSCSFASIRASVSWEPTRGMSLRRRSRYGTAPMWSSWPCVRITATTSSSRSSMYEKSGRIRSTPGWVSSGKRTPQSTISSLPSISNTAMFRPISPSPPSGTILSVPWGRRGGVTRPVRAVWVIVHYFPGGRVPVLASGEDQPRFRQIPADGFDLGFVRLHEGQTDNRVGQDSLPFKNLLGRHGPLDAGHGGADDGLQLEVDLAGSPKVIGVDGVDELAEAAGGDVGGDPYQADCAQRHPGKGQPVIARVEEEVRFGHDAGGCGEVRLGVLDGDDVGVLGQPDHGVGLNRYGGTPGDVVEHDGDVHCGGDGLEVRADAGLAGLVVVRGHQEEAVDAEGGCLLGKVHRVRGVVRAGTGNDGCSAAHGILDGA